MTALDDAVRSKGSDRPREPADVGTSISVSVSPELCQLARRVVYRRVH